MRSVLAQAPHPDLARFTVELLQFDSRFNVPIEGVLHPHGIEVTQDRKLALPRPN